MPVIAPAERRAAMQRLGLSDALRSLSEGICAHPALRGEALGPSERLDRGARAPQGEALVPLWERGTRVCAVRGRPGALEFIEFSVELPDEVEPVARTEQGLWATVFDRLHEADLPLDALRGAAAAVGFRFLERQLASREAAEDTLQDFHAHRRWRRALVDEIDCDAA